MVEIGYLFLIKTHHQIVWIRFSHQEKSSEADTNPGPAQIIIWRRGSKCGEAQDVQLKREPDLGDHLRTFNTFSVGQGVGRSFVKAKERKTSPADWGNFLMELVH